MQKQYRHEWKHEISQTDLISIRQRMRAVGEMDSHARDGKYLIRSLYFDNLNDKALMEKVNGVDRREKYRIRYYNYDSSLIHLEKKSRLNGLGTKYSAVLTPEQVERIINNDIDWMITDEQPLVRELYAKMRGQGLKPRTIVDYTREPFIYRAGNVRVTLDYHIRTGMRSLDFLDPECVTIPVPGDPIILEIKWDNYFPDIIRDAVQLPGRRVTSFSKYAQCRMYE